MSERPSTVYRKNFNQIKNNILTRQKRSIVESGVAETQKHDDEKLKQNYSKYGTRKLIPKGTIARLSGVPYPNLENLSEGDAQGFHYGYYDRGNTNIKILIETGNTDIPILSDNIEKVHQEINEIFGLSQKEIPYKDLDEKTKYSETLRAIGFTDGKNSEITFDNLNEVIKNCTYYKEGYELGKSFRETIESQNKNLKGKGR